LWRYTAALPRSYGHGTYRLRSGRLTLDSKRRHRGER
jgi:hypothetical protein